MPHNPTMDYVGMRIRDERCRRGLTIEALAARIGVGASAFASWERGDRTCDVEDLTKIAAGLDIEAITLLPGYVRDPGRIPDWGIWPGLTDDQVADHAQRIREHLT